MRVIYEPKGKAFEYSPLALNLYRGCAHACKYCYSPSVLRMSREAFAATPQPRKDILKNLEKDARELGRDPRPVLMCFTSDPYQPVEEKHCITRRAIEIMGEAGVRMAVLTKGGPLAARDFDLMQKYDVAFGTTLLFLSDTRRLQWEPNAASILGRVEAIREAHRLGIRTWVSVEPVIYPDEALQVLDLLEPWVDIWKVGKLNHDPKREKELDWRGFLTQVLAALSCRKAEYYIKDDLWAFADAGMRSVPRSRGVQIWQPQQTG